MSGMLRSPQRSSAGIGFVSSASFFSASGVVWHSTGEISSRSKSGAGEGEREGLLLTTSRCDADAVAASVSDSMIQPPACVGHRNIPLTLLQLQPPQRRCDANEGVNDAD